MVPSIKNSNKYQLFVYTVEYQTVLFLPIQFSLSDFYTSIWSIDRTLSSATTLDQSKPWSNGNEGVTPYFPMLQHYWCLIIRLFYVISRLLSGGGLPLSRDAVGIFYCPSRLGLDHFCVNIGTETHLFISETPTAPQKSHKLNICFFNMRQLVNVRYLVRKCPWCYGYRRWKWTRRHEFKSWTRLIAFHTALIPLGKVWIQLFSLQVWVNSRADWFL